MIDFGNQTEKRKKLEKKLTELELTSAPDNEALWNSFEQTGSIEAFLTFMQKAGKAKELVLATNPS